MTTSRTRAPWLVALVGAALLAGVANTQLRTCSSGKRGYGSKRHAKRATRGVSNRIRAYLCPECHEWHVTRSE